MTAHSHTSDGGALTVRNGPSPRVMALRFRIWAYCEPRGWDCDVVEIAEALGESMQRINKICTDRGWCNRLRHGRGKEAWAHGNRPAIIGGHDVLTQRERMTFAGAAE